jgi:hypothetical protein
MSDQSGAGVTPSPTTPEPGTGATPIPTQQGTVIVPATPPDAGATPSPASPPSDGDRRDADSGAQTDADSQRDASLSADDLRKVLDASRQEARRAQRELKRYQDAEKAREDANKTELQRMTERAESAERRVAEMERSELAKDIAREAGIPTLWHRLTGTDARSLRADALRIREELQSIGALPETPGMDGGVRSLGVPPQPGRFEDMIRGRAGQR